MVMTLNGQRVLLHGTAMLRKDDTLRIEGPPSLVFSIVEDAPTHAVSVTANGPDFLVSIDGFNPGRSMTSMAKGTLGGGKDVLILTIADRIAEMKNTSIYRLHYMVAETL